MALPELPEGYYLDNFIRVLDAAGTLYADLLAPEERAFAEDFRRFSLDARRLYVRLMTRKGPLFRSDKLAYAEIQNISEAARELEKASFLGIDLDWEIPECLALVTRTEMIRLFGDGKCDLWPMKKDGMIVAVAESFPEAAIRARIRSSFSLYAPLKIREVELYRLLFFGNLDQDLTAFVLEDLGLTKYEPYPVSKEARLFQSRAILEAAYRLEKIRQRMHEAAESRDRGRVIALAQEVPPTCGEPYLERRRGRILNTAARELERDGEWRQALGHYEAADLPPARERQARILDRLGRAAESRALCSRIIAEPFDEAELEFAEKFLPRLEKKLGGNVSRSRAAPVPAMSLMLPPPGGLGVEEAVLARLVQGGFQGYFVENLMWTGLFGLAFWDIIFMPVKGAFFNRYQGGPRDLLTPDFRRMREAAIMSRLERVRTADEWPDEMRSVYADKKGTANHLVHWERLSPEMLEMALERIPRSHMADIFDRLSRDIKGNKTGFPDLIVFAPGPNGAGARGRAEWDSIPGTDIGLDGREPYVLLEVKSPGDQIQNNQRRWMRYFDKFSVPYRVVNVMWETKPEETRHTPVCPVQEADR
ncbi:Fanconi-associated nuclease 1 [subsurface metagenome]